MARYVCCPKRISESFLSCVNWIVIILKSCLIFEGGHGSGLWSLFPVGPSCQPVPVGIAECGAKEESEKKIRRKRGRGTSSPLPHPLVVFLCLLTPLCDVPTIWTPGTGYPVVYKDFSTRQGWSVKKPLLICQSGWSRSSKRASINSLSLLEINNKDLSAASQKLLAGLRCFTTCLSLIGYE